MTSDNHNSLWREFPKTATEFEARFATEEDCRAYWIEANCSVQRSPPSRLSLYDRSSIGARSMYRVIGAVYHKCPAARLCLPHVHAHTAACD